MFWKPSLVPVEEGQWCWRQESTPRAYCNYLGEPEGQPTRWESRPVGHSTCSELRSQEGRGTKHEPQISSCTIWSQDGSAIHLRYRRLGESVHMNWSCNLVHLKCFQEARSPEWGQQRQRGTGESLHLTVAIRGWRSAIVLRMGCDRLYHVPG